MAKAAVAHDDQPVPSHQASHQMLFENLNYTSSKMISLDMFSSDRGKFKELIPAVTLKGVTIAALWANTFSNNSEFLREYHQRRQNRDSAFNPWEMSADRSSGTRFFSCQTIVEVPRAGSLTLLNEAHRFAYSTCDGGCKLLLHISSQTPNVPAGGTFRCEALIQLKADSPEGDCSITVYGGIKKMSAMFTPIAFIATPRALKDMTTCYLAMVDLVSEKLQGGQLTLKAPAGGGETVPTPSPSPSIAPEYRSYAQPTMRAPEPPPPTASTGMSIGLLLLTFCVVVVGLLSVSAMNSINASLQRANDLRDHVQALHPLEGERRSPLFSDSGDNEDICVDDGGGLSCGSTDQGGAARRGSSTSSSPSLASLVSRNEASLLRILTALHDLSARVNAAESAAASATTLVYVLAAASGIMFVVVYLVLRS